MWSKPAIAAFERAIAAAEKWKPALEKLAELAKHSPEFADRIRDLIARADNTETVSKVALSLLPDGE